MKILVTGVAGFLGSALAEQLLCDGHVLVACARHRDNLPAHPRLRFCRADLNHLLLPETWWPFLDGVQAVVNCAGILREHRAGEFERIHYQAR